MLKRELTKDENKHLSKIYNFYLYKDIPIDEIERVRQAILCDDFLMKLYGSKDLDSMINRYFTEVTNLGRLLQDSDREQNIANCLEYIRFSCMNDNFYGINGVRYFESLSDSELSCAFLGKGTSASQSRFMRDVLQDNIPCRVLKLDYYEYPQSLQCTSTSEGVVFETKQGNMYLDPSRYSGSGKNSNLVVRLYHDEIKEIPISDEKRKKGREKAGGLLTRELKIKNLVSKITTSDMTPEEKNQAFVQYIRQNKQKYDVPVKHEGIIVNGRMLEIPKLLELFYMSSGIPYVISPNTKKENNIYVIKSSKGEQIVTDLSFDRKKDKIKDGKVKSV